MIYTSSHYNYNSNRYPGVAISGNRGKDANFMGKSYPKLAPKLKFWQVWHNNIGKVSEEENNKYYIEEYYKQVLSKLNPKEVYDELDNSVLLCYEDNNMFCHRHIVAAWFELTLNKIIFEIKSDGYITLVVDKPKYIKEYLNEIMNKDSILINKKELIDKLTVDVKKENSIYDFSDRKGLKTLYCLNIYQDYFDSLDQIKNYINSYGLNNTPILTVEYLGEAANKSDVFKVTNYGNNYKLYTACDEGGYGIYMHEESIKDDRFVWRYLYGDIKKMYSAFRDREIIFNNDIYKKIEDSNKKTLRLIQKKYSEK